MSGSRSAEAPDVQDQFSRDQFSRGEVRARLMEHLPDITREPQRPLDERFGQGWDNGVVQDH